MDSDQYGYESDTTDGYGNLSIADDTLLLANFMLSSSFQKIDKHIVSPSMYSIGSSGNTRVVYKINWVNISILIAIVAGVILLGYYLFFN